MKEKKNEILPQEEEEKIIFFLYRREKGKNKRIQKEGGKR